MICWGIWYSTPTATNPNYIIVINHGRGSDFSIYENSYEKRRAAVLGAVTITLPKLHEASMRKIDFARHQFFGAAINNKSGDSEGLPGIDGAPAR